MASAFRISRRTMAIVAALAILTAGVAAAMTTESDPPNTPPQGMRQVADPLYGWTLENIPTKDVIAATKASPRMLTTRLVFSGSSASDFKDQVTALHPHTYLLGQPLDSTDMKNLASEQHRAVWHDYLTTLGDGIDIWEIGNEIGGAWLGDQAAVAAKVTEAYNAVSAAGKRSALTLWYNPGCQDSGEVDPLTYSQQHFAPEMRNGVNYVFLSYYEMQCNNYRPDVATLTSLFQQLRALYPTAKVGFGEVGMEFPAGHSAEISEQRGLDIMNYYYGLRIAVPEYVGGYFWWYAQQDFLPASQRRPLWNNFIAAVQKY